MKLPQIFLALGIAILTAFLVGYLLQLVYPAPENTDKCYENFACYNKPIMINETINQTEIEICQERVDICVNEANIPNVKYSRNIFIILTIIGILLIYLGGFIIKTEAVNAGILAGGIAVILYGIVSTLRYWDEMPVYLKLSMLIISLGILVFSGWKLGKKK